MAQKSAGSHAPLLGKGGVQLHFAEGVCQLKVEQSDNTAGQHTDKRQGKERREIEALLHTPIAMSQGSVHGLVHGLWPLF